jgi:hypothetical protein
MDPKTGAVILLGSLAVSATVAWLLSRLTPFGQETLDQFKLSLTNDGAWMIIGAWVIFPVVFAVAFLRLAQGVDARRLAFAYAGGTYFLQSYAEFVARDNVSLWPELLLTVVATIIFHRLAKKNAPDPEDESASSS